MNIEDMDAFKELSETNQRILQMLEKLSRSLKDP